MSLSISSSWHILYCIAKRLSPNVFIAPAWIKSQLNNTPVSSCEVIVHALFHKKGTDLWLFGTIDNTLPLL